jgi:UDPglucose 6-dehydrogenase
METPQITIYGFGYVGKAIYHFLKDHYSLQVFDPLIKDPLVKNSMDDIKKTPFAVICVPTPQSEDGSCDISIVESTIKDSDHDFYLIKSTIVPGTTNKLIKATGKKIAFSPEYIGEGKYEIPFWLGMPHPTIMKLHQFHIFGGERSVTKKWIELWQQAAGWNPTYAQTDTVTAELVKYMENSFLATKKIFCDEFYDIAETLGVDYNELKELWLLDGRMGRSMTFINPEKRGFGGKCLPKDVNAIVKHIEDMGHSSKLLKGVLEINKKIRKE